VSYGHRWPDIQDYTLGQLQLFLDAHQTIEAEQRRNRLIETAIAAQGDSKKIKETADLLGRK
jgi:hypothetical protein